jgi:diguanylate cyclase (GGDEF)-like protein
LSNAADTITTTAGAAPTLDLATCLASAWQLTPDLWLRLAVLVGLLLVALWALTRSFFPGQKTFAGLQMAMACWLAITAVERAAQAPMCKAALALSAWPVIMAVPFCWALFLHLYLNSHYRAPSWRRLLLLASPGLLLLALGPLSNAAHGLFYTAGTGLQEAAGGALRMYYQRGPLFYASALYSYALLLLSLALLLRALHRTQGAERRTWFGFVVMSLVPWVANVAYLGFDVRVFDADPTPFAFAVAVVGQAWFIHTQQLFKVAPLARHMLFTELPDPVLILDAAGRVVEANRAAFVMCDAEPARGLALAQWPRFGAQVAERLSQPAAGRFIQLRNPTAIYELRQQAIGHGKQEIGRLLQLRDVTEQQRTQASIVHTLAERNAQLSQVAELQEELRELSLRDPLTGLYNRRALAQRFDVDWAHQQRTDQALTLVLIDIDHFKRVNDTLGHAAGDSVLCGLAGILKRGLRASDSVFRMGGEEFALLLPNADVHSAAVRVDALRAALRAAQEASQQTAEMGDLRKLNQAVTFSAGIAACTVATQSLDSLLQAADRALYAAKDGGRDRSVLAPEL